MTDNLNNELYLMIKVCHAALDVPKIMPIYNIPMLQ